MLGRLGALGLTLLLGANPAAAVDFANVVSLGDSALDVGESVERAPVVSEHVAWRLGAAHTNLAVDGTTASSLLATGQHTTAAASFGSGDLAIVWVGAEDMVANQFGIILNNFSFLDGMESDLDTAVATLRGAGLEVVILSLPDLSLTPAVQKNAPQFSWDNFQTASRRWRNRIEDVAAIHGALVIDIYDLSQTVDAMPELFALYGMLPVPAPEKGKIQNCPSCIYRDNAHPSAMTQGFFANEVIATLNTTFDPAGTMSVTPLSNLELFNLTQLTPVPTGPLVAFGIAAGLFSTGMRRLRRSSRN